MSSQLQVSGEAKIRDIQGPVVANSGVITALDGAANQYVRGDGTLAIFPTSTGGGSSVSYYLNGSVNQGTFGGSTYYQMSRNAIVGTGTNFSTSSDGLIAQFITDANDPDVVSIPSGNWNVEFFMNVSASSGALASFYVEIYKYDGSTFTLLATNVATPEQLTNTTTVDAYFTSVAMPLSAMAITDRLAIRIFANVASKTVTLYTEDNRLCQIVTTFSNGLTSLNNLTDQSQYLTTGTSGTDFNIVSSGDTHTFNIPVASASNTGKLSSTDWSTFNNKVPYTGAIADVDLGSNNFTAFGGTFNSILTINATGNQARALYMVTGTAGSQYGSGTGVNLFSEATDNLSILFTTAFTTRKAILNGANLTTAKTFTLPDASGTIALTSNINYPVTSVFGRTGAVVAASGDYTTTQVTEGTNLYYTDARSRAALSFTAGSGAYNSTTGVITIPTDNNQIANGAGYITSSALSGYLPLTGGTLTGGLNGTTATFSGLGTFYQLTMTGATAGRLFYAQTGGVFSQSGNLVWNNSTEQLGVGTPNPSAVVTAFSTNAATQLKAAGTAPAITFSNTLTSASLACVFGLATANNHFITGTAAGDMAIANQSTSAGAIVFGTGTFEKMRMTAAGTFSIGNTNSTYNLDVTGTGRFTSTLLLGGALSGTSATFSGAFTFANGGGNYLYGGALKFLYSNGTNTNNIYSGGVNGLRVVNQADSAVLLSIADTGAATFSSSVTTPSITNGGSFKMDYASNASSRSWRIISDSYNFGDFSIQQSTTQAGSTYADRLLISASGNVGIGTSSPSQRLTIAQTNGYPIIDFYNSGTGFGDIGYNAGTSTFNLSSYSSTPLAFYTNSAERMRITSGGELYWNLTGTSGGSLNTGGVLFRNNSGKYVQISTGVTIDTGLIYFYKSDGAGSVTNTGSIATSGNSTVYNTTSDYRLKQDFQDYNGLRLISKIKTYDYEWKSDKTRMFGVIAHELAEVLPYAVTGKKDAEEMQSVDYSKLVPILVKAIQELKAEIEILKNK